MEKIVLTLLVLGLVLLVVITLLLTKISAIKSDKANKAQQKSQVSMIEKMSESKLNQEKEKISIEKKEQVAMIQTKKPKVERYCYQKNGKFYWKARKNPKPQPKKAPNYDLFNAEKYYKEHN